jgi:lysozyme
MSIHPMVVDIYHGDTVTDLKATHAFGIRGVIHKATEGLHVTDQLYGARRKLAADAGMLWGGYHFMRPGDVQTQVDHFLSAAKPDDHTLVALDHEDQKVPLIDAMRFMQAIERTLKRKPVLYSGFLIKEQLGNRIDSYMATHRLWLSHYSANPKWPRAWAKPWLIQFTGDGVGPEPHNVPGISCGKGIDINSYDGTPEQLAAEWAS